MDFQIQSKYIPLVTCVVGVFSVVGSYLVAHHYGHVDPFPYTDITHCTIHYPEYFIARIGFPTCSILIAILWPLVTYFLQQYVDLINIIQNKYQNNNNIINYNNNNNNFNLTPYQNYEFTIKVKTINTVGAFSGLLFLLSIAVITEEHLDWIAHSVGAGGFFLLTLYNILLVTHYYIKIWNIIPHFVSKKSYLTKIGIVVIALILLILQILARFYPEISKYIPEYFFAATEWIAVLIIILYLGSFYYDFESLELTLKDKQNFINNNQLTNNNIQMQQFDQQQRQQNNQQYF